MPGWKSNCETHSNLRAMVNLLQTIGLRHKCRSEKERIRDRTHQ